jgi:hypothetical protein
MNATAKFAIVGGTGHTARWRTAPRVEKANASNARYGERDDNVISTITLAPLPRHAHLSQIETAQYEPEWNGPRLTAPFVAQVLGQVLTQDGDAKRSALSAYRSEAKVFRALLCDRRV